MNRRIVNLKVAALMALGPLALSACTHPYDVTITREAPNYSV